MKAIDIMGCWFNTRVLDIPVSSQRMRPIRIVSVPTGRRWIWIYLHPLSSSHSSRIQYKSFSRTEGVASISNRTEGSTVLDRGTKTFVNYQHATQPTVSSHNPPQRRGLSHPFKYVSDSHITSMPKHSNLTSSAHEM
uniref:Uncharacterized protein n=1 Tax=Rhipicephalus zambeziensis TaxID=60191 RepID=A0A224YHK0_9ACAR